MHSEQIDPKGQCFYIFELILIFKRNKTPVDEWRKDIPRHFPKRSCCLTNMEKVFNIATHQSHANTNNNTSSLSDYWSFKTVIGELTSVARPVSSDIADLMVNWHSIFKTVICRCGWKALALNRCPLTRQWQRGGHSSRSKVGGPRGVPTTG